MAYGIPVQSYLSKSKGEIDFVNSKMYFRMMNEDYTTLIFAEAFYLATKGGGAFFSNV